MSNTFFHQATIQSITGGTFVNGTPSTLDKLSAAAAHSALHDAPARTDKSRCHPHTRTDVLDHLERWAQGICDEGAHIFWLHGGAGAGKSAVMQSLAERCVPNGPVLGCFFFFRTDATRNTLEVLIPTLVYQIFLRFRSEIHLLDSILDHDPGVFKKSFDVQLRDVFLPVLRHLVQLGCISNAPDSPRVFLIDGLDECNNSSHQQTIIRAVATFCFEDGLPVKFLIASRPGLAISTAFDWFTSQNRALRTIPLSDEPSSDHDIHIFLDDQFSKMRDEHAFARMIPANWPHMHDIKKLVRKASQHFIYATIVADYIWAAQETPMRSLQVVLGLETSRTNTPSPFAVLDALYSYILEQAVHRNKVLETIGHLLHHRTDHSIVAVCLILDYSEDDFRVFMADMASLVHIPAHSQDCVRFRHASLDDFLRDPSRAGDLYIDRAIYLESHFDRYFDLVEQHSKCGHLVCEVIDCDLYEFVREAILASGKSTTAQVEFVQNCNTLASRPAKPTSLPPEVNVSTAFRSLSNMPSTRREIHMFLKDIFESIRATHPSAHMLPPNWPDIYDMAELLCKASGLFIYAATVAEHIRVARESPVRSLQVILGLEVSWINNPSPVPVLDALYRHILGQAVHCNEVLEIIGHLLLCHGAEVSMCTISQICIIRDYSEGEFRAFMAGLGPLLCIRENPLADLTFRHGSFVDFLRDPSRSGDLYIDTNQYLESHLDRYFDLFQLYCKHEDGLSKINCRDLHTLICHTARDSQNAVVAQRLAQEYNLQYVDSCLKRVVSHFHCYAHCALTHLGTIRFFWTKSIIGDEDYQKQLQYFMDILEEAFSLSAQSSGTYAPLAKVLMPYLHSCHPTRYAGMLAYLCQGRAYALAYLGVTSIPKSEIVSLRDHQGLASTQSVTAACDAIMSCLIARYKEPCLDHADGVFRCCRSTTQCPDNYDQLSLPCDIDVDQIPDPLSADRPFRMETFWWYPRYVRRQGRLCAKLRDLLILLSVLLDMMGNSGFSRTLLDRTNWEILLTIPLQDLLGDGDSRQHYLSATDCLDGYRAKVEHDLERRIDAGDPAALLDKVWMYQSNALDLQERKEAGDPTALHDISWMFELNALD